MSCTPLRLRCLRQLRREDPRCQEWVWQGIAINNKTKAATNIKMPEIQVGLGLGVKEFRLVWVFETEKASTTIRRASHRQHF